MTSLKMTPTPPRGTPVPALFTLIFSLPIALFIYLLVHGPGLESQFLPPPYSTIVHDAVLETRQLVIQFASQYLQTECRLGEVCMPWQKRPILEDGRLSHAVWDMPRKLMKDGFNNAIVPDAKVSYMWEEPLVVYYDNVLSDEDIDFIIEQATPRFETSYVVDDEGKPKLDDSRTSSTAWLYMHEHPRVLQIVQKITALAGFTHQHSEHIGVNRYEKTQYFNPHHDFLREDQLGLGEFAGCQRSTTALIYLSDVEKGGETVFVRKGGMDGRFEFDRNNPDHLVVQPKRGRVLLWYDMHPYTEMVDHRTLHGGAPVSEGVKIAATIFIRNCTRSEQKPPILDTDAATRESADQVKEAVNREADIELPSVVASEPPVYSKCQLGDICAPDQRRPLLEDGRESHAVWDLPRKLMKDNFAGVKSTIPAAQVNHMWKEPLVVYFDNVLSEDDIDYIIQKATPKFERSLVVGENGEAKPDESRTSSTAWLFMNEDPRFQAIVHRITGLAGFTHEHSEHIGVNRYEKTQYFNPHYDFLQEDQLGLGEFAGCQRTSTALLYLSDVAKGGETVFVRKGGMDGQFDFDTNNPDHLVVKPKRGRVLVWYDMHPYTEMVDHRTLHGGAPVTEGVKMAATVFIRNCTRQVQQPITEANDASSSDVSYEEEDAVEKEAEQEIASHVGHDTTPQSECQLGDVCAPGQKRPLLEDGRESHAVWDVARKLMKNNFAHVKTMVPGAQVNYMWEEPLVVYFDNVLSDDDVDFIIQEATPKFKRSLVVDDAGKPKPDESRTSSTAWLFMHESPRFQAIIDRITSLAGFTHKHSEHIGVNRYEKTQYFNPHHDFLREDQLGFGEFPGCQRTSTALIYLSDVAKGGETVFVRKGGMDGRFDFDANNPDHLIVKPKRGRVLLWYDMHPYTEMVDHRTLHGGAPVSDGVKIAATVFIRNCTRQVQQPTAATSGDNIEQNAHQVVDSAEPQAEGPPVEEEQGSSDSDSRPKEEL